MCAFIAFFHQQYYKNSTLKIAVMGKINYKECYQHTREKLEYVQFNWCSGLDRITCTVVQIKNETPLFILMQIILQK